MDTKFEPLPQEEVKKAIEGRNPVRPPAHQHRWVGEGLVDYHGKEAVNEVFGTYPQDVVTGGIVQPGVWEVPEGFPSDYRWAWPGKQAASSENQAKDQGNRVLDDWSELDPFLEDFPKVAPSLVFAGLRETVNNSGGRYVEARAWNNFYERLWMLRGMQNLLMDFHLYPYKLQKLTDALLELVLELVEGAGEAGADGFSTSNDLGHQTGLMMEPENFRKFLKPLHVEVANKCHEYGMDYWMHSCGNLTDIVPDLIEAGVDCLHPIQYGAMDWQRTAELKKGRMTAWGGVDVQHVLPEATPDEVRSHVRELIDTFHEFGEGRCIVAAGNGITGATPLENVDAFLDETFRYGLQVGKE